MSAARLVHLLLLLETHERLSARALAAALEVSVRTVHRDIEALSGAGVAVYAERGAAGGFRLLDGRRFQLNTLTADEAAALPYAGLPAVAAELGVGRAAAAARAKLASALPVELYARMQESAAEVYMDLDRGAGAAVSVQLLRGLHDAVRRRRVIAVRTREGDGAQRVVELAPLGLVRSADGWHLVARADGEVVSIEVATIALARATGEWYGPDPRFDLGRWWRARKLGQ